MIYFSALLLSLLLTIVLTPILVRGALHFGIVDKPEARKVHQVPVPRIGGVAIAIGSFIPLALWQQAGDFTLAYLAGAGILVLMGLWDDVRGLDYKIKFLGQLVAALIVVYYGGVSIGNLGGLLPAGMLLPPWLSVPLTLLVIVGVTNAINLSDGLDGLAGGICFLCLCGIAYLAYTTENQGVLFIAITLAGAVFGFLRFNTHPATLFMGDAGSLFLGFSVIVLTLRITQGSTPLSPLLPLIILGFPVLDTLTVMSERIAEGRSPFSPDKNHFHHRMMRLGVSHTESVFLIYLLQSLLVIAAIVFRYHSEWLLLGSYLGFCSLVLIGFFAAERLDWKVRRFDLFDRVIKGRLRTLVKEGFLVRVTFQMVESGLPLMLLFTCLIPAAIPGYFQLLAGALMGLLLLTWLVTKSWLRRGMLTLSLYLFIPFVVYTAITQMAPWMTPLYQNMYSLFFLAFLILTILTLRFSRREKGFHMNPMDFLILFIVFVVPIISGTYLKYANLGLVVAMTIMLFFSYEVLIGELRGRLDRLVVMTMAALGTVLIRGFL